jgi:hypothetical protein
MTTVKRKPAKKCKWCGTPERVDAIGYSNISPHLGYCVDCITRAMTITDRRHNHEESPQARS